MVCKVIPYIGVKFRQRRKALSFFVLHFCALSCALHPDTYLSPYELLVMSCKSPSGLSVDICAAEVACSLGGRKSLPPGGRGADVCPIEVKCSLGGFACRDSIRSNGFTADEIQRLWQDTIYSVYQDVTKEVCSMYCKIVIEHTNYG